MNTINKKQGVNPKKQHSMKCPKLYCRRCVCDGRTPDDVIETENQTIEKTWKAKFDLFFVTKIKGQRDTEKWKWGKEESIPHQIQRVKLFVEMELDLSRQQVVKKIESILHTFAKEIRDK